ncbi:MAG: dual specificity protein phosphatase family protein [Thaumarchaeota archaeon]|nr:dual specificity protein phosphatase family protein [Nitrososphaerota archaeon]
MVVENLTRFFLQCAKVSFAARLYGACVIYCACALETALYIIAVSHPLKKEHVEQFDKTKTGFPPFLTERKELLKIAEEHGLIDSETKQKCKKIFTIRDAHSHTPFLRGKTYSRITSLGINKIHDEQITLGVLEETRKILETILYQSQNIEPNSNLSQMLKESLLC